MATPNKAKQPPSKDPDSSSHEISGKNTYDAPLLNIVRTGSQRIVASLLASAARCGDDHDWAEMSEYQALANQLLTKGGLQQVIQPPAATMAAGAGR